MKDLMEVELEELVKVEMEEFKVDVEAEDEVDDKYVESS